jgi:hypothetical protein
MKRLAIATAVLTALAAGAQAGSLPKPIHLVNRMKVYSPTHYVSGRGPGGGGGGGGDSMAPAEGRQSAPAPAPKTASAGKPAPKPAPAD